MLEDKKVLFLGPVFHDYHILIAECFQSMGATPYFYAERSYGYDFKIVNNFFKGKLASYQKKHYFKILEQTKNTRFDYLFVIRGYMLPVEFLIEFKRLHPHTKLIMYQWDSNTGNRFDHLLPYFDKAYSFDFEDCNTFSLLEYLPLFFSNDIRNAIDDKSKSEYDFFFMGWFFPERYRAVVKFRDYVEAKGFRIKAFLYMPWTSYFKKVLLGHKLDKSIISLKPMSRIDYLNFLRLSRVMVDVSSPNQTGLSMRVIEALASQTRVLTNNQKIKEDTEIYDISRVFFFDEKEPYVEPSLLSYELQKSNNLLSIDKWLIRLFTNV